MKIILRCLLASVLLTIATIFAFAYFRTCGLSSHAAAMASKSQNWSTSRCGCCKTSVSLATVLVGKAHRPLLSGYRLRKSALLIPPRTWTSRNHDRRLCIGGSLCNDAQANEVIVVVPFGFLEHGGYIIYSSIKKNGQPSLDAKDFTLLRIRFVLSELAILFLCSFILCIILSGVCYTCFNKLMFIRSRRRLVRGLCPNCKYSIGVPLSVRCPECGSDRRVAQVDPVE